MASSLDRLVLVALTTASVACKGTDRAPKDLAPAPQVAAPARVVLESTPRAEALLARVRAAYQVTVDGAPRPVLGEASLGAVTIDGRTVHARPSGVRARGATPVAAVDVLLPELADGAVEVRSTASDLAVRVRPLGFSAQPVEWSEHVAVHPGVEPGVDAFRVVQPGGVEDFYEVTRARDELVFEQQITLVHVAGLRLVGGTLELLDRTGNPLIRATAPRVFDRAGVSRGGELRVVGCRYDEDPRGPWGRPVVDPGSDTCRVVARVDGRGLAYPVLFDPTWQATGSTKQTHAYHQLHLLRGGADKGKVLLVNGTGSFPGVTELFDPSATPPSWASGASFPGVVTLAIGSTSVALADGTVVALGGAPATGSTACQATVVVRNPATSTWSPGAAMSTARCYAAATAATVDGKEAVLVSGGQLGTGAPTSFPPVRSVQAYDVASDAWTTLPNLLYPRARHRAVRLGDGRVLVAGGEDYDGATFATVAWATAEIWSPTTKAFTVAPSMVVKRSGGELVALPGALPRAVFAGGTQTSSYTGMVDSLEVFDGAKWTLLSARMSQPRQHFSSAVLDDGRVLFTGGYSYGPTFGLVVADTADLFVPGVDPTAGTLVGAAVMAERRYFHATVSLPGRGALIAGGLATTVSVGTEVTSSEVFDTAIGGPCAAGCGPGTTCVDGVCCSKASCPSGQTCNAPGREGVCTKPKGEGCTTHGECATGYCVSGVCCDSACTGGCNSCAEPGSVGTCKPAAAGTDPLKFCGSDPHCSRRCDGTGKCQAIYPPAGTACATSASDAGTGAFCVAFACSGFGSCLSKTNDCGLSCTTSVACDEASKTCTANLAGIKAGHCVIDGRCWALGDGNPKDACKLCDPILSKTSWSPSPAASCTDGGVGDAASDTGPLDTGLVDTGIDTGVTDSGGLSDTGADTGTGSGTGDAAGDGGDDAGPGGDDEGGCSTSGPLRVSLGTTLGGVGLATVLGLLPTLRRRRRR